MKKLAGLLLFGIVVVGCNSNPVPTETLKSTSTLNPTEKWAPVEGDLLSKVGIKPYPGAKITKQEQNVTENLSPDETRYHISFSAPDPAEKVMAFYKPEFKTEPSHTGSSWMLAAQTDHAKNNILLTATDKGGKTEAMFSIIIYKK